AGLAAQEWRATPAAGVLAGPQLVWLSKTRSQTLTKLGVVGQGSEDRLVLRERERGSKLTLTHIQTHSETHTCCREDEVSPKRLHPVEKYGACVCVCVCVCG